MTIFRPGDDGPANRKWWVRRNIDVQGTYYVPSSALPVSYCRRERYERFLREHPEKTMHNPVIHRYYNEGWCVNTDGVGKPLSWRGVTRFDTCPSFYPKHLTRKVKFPLGGELAGEYHQTSYGAFWENGFGGFEYENWLVMFSLSQRSVDIYRICVSVDKKGVRCNAKQYILPPTPLIIAGSRWKGEMPHPAYTLSDLKGDVIKKMKEYKPAFSACEEKAGKPAKYQARIEALCDLIENKWKKSGGFSFHEEGA